jgi:acyl carrier protein
MTQFMTERDDVLAQIKDVLYDRDWIKSSEVESVKESSEFKRIFALDFSGQGRLDTIDSLERLYGIQLNDTEIKNMTKVSQLIDAVMEQLEIQD